MKLPPLKIKKQLIAHPVARAYFAYSLIILGLTLVALDAWLIPYLEQSGKVIGLGWKDDNLKINQFMAARNHADTNNAVWRSDSMPVAVHCQKSKRILIIGDSYVWGHGYPNVNTMWWRQLQSELQRRGYNDVEVIAAGLRGLATWQELAVAKKVVPVYKPDAVIWGYVTNDPDEIGHLPNGNKFVSAIQLPADADVSKHAENVTRALFPNLAYQLFAMREHSRDKDLNGPRYGYRFGEWELQILKGDSFAQYGQTVKEVADYLHGQHMPSFAIDFPDGVMCDCAQTESLLRSRRPYLDMIKDYYTVRYEPVKAVFQHNGVQFVDLLDDFIAYAKQHGATSVEQRFSYGINPMNSHPGPLATRFYAIKAADVLEKQFPQCLGAKSPKVEITASKPHFNDWLPSWIGLIQGPQVTCLSYPPEDGLLTMPIGKPFVQLNFDHPTALKNIALNGAGLKTADIYLTAEDPSTHFDTSELHELGERKGSSISWQIPPAAWSANISSIRISARVKGEDNGLKLVLNPSSGALQ